MNRNQRPLGLLLIFCLLTILAVGCGEDGDGTTSFDERPDGSVDVISDRQLDLLVQAGLDIHLGYDPPSEILGTWMMDEMLVTYDERGAEGSSRADSIYRFFDLIDEQIEIEWHHPNHDSETEGRGSYISGGNGCFTTYAGSTGTSQGCTIEMVDVISGCLTSEDTIEGFQKAFVLVGKGSESGCSNLIPVGVPRIISNQVAAYRLE